MAYTRVNWENFPSTATPRNATNLNVMDAGIDDVDTRLTTAEGEIDNLQTGWIPANETWTYASVDDPTGVITISGDVTTKYSLGMRIKFTNGGNVIYGIITAISYSSPNTTITFLHEIDPTDSLALYLMANSAITNPYYSCVKAPFGFPMNKNKWKIFSLATANFTKTNPTQNTWYQTGINITLPIGDWRVYVECLTGGKKGGAKYLVTNTTLSTTTNSETDDEFTATIDLGNSTLDYRAFVHTEKNLIIPTKTPYYQLIKTNQPSLDSLYVWIKNIIVAECNYL